MDGRYTILRKLGQGAYGEVFLAKHTTLGVYRAIKRIHTGQDRLQTGRNEVEILKNFSHPSLPIIYDIDEDDVYFYIVEEYIEGQSLSEYIEVNGPLTADRAVGFAISICEALSYMQENGGICHLDIKPENIIVTDKGVRLLDFGSSLFTGTAKDYVTGTKGYAAPEMYTNQDLDVRCDIYAVGMLIGYMLTGQPYFKRENQQSICSDNLVFIINKCISHQREDRYQSPRELIIALNQSQKLIETTKNPITIGIIGSLQRIGTTHVSVMLTAGLAGSGKKSLLCLMNESRRGAWALPFYENTRKIICDSGVYRVDGITIIPSYQGYANAKKDKDMERYRYVFEDLGCIDAISDEELGKLSLDICILVGGHTMYELSAFAKACKRLKKAGIMPIGAFNFTDGQGYQRIRKESGNLCEEAFRVPYIVNPYQFTDRGGYLEKIIFKERSCENNRHRRRRESMRSYTFSNIISQLSVKRNRSQGGSV